MRAGDESGGPVPQRIRELSGGGVTRSVDAIASAATTQQAIASLRPGGRHVQVGLTSAEDKGQIAIPADLLVNTELEIVGSASNPHGSYGEIFALIAQGKLDPASLIARRVGLTTSPACCATSIPSRPTAWTSSRRSPSNGHASAAASRAPACVGACPSGNAPSMKFSAGEAIMVVTIVITTIIA